MTATDSDDLELLERLGGSGATVHRAVVRTTGRVIVTKHAAWDRPDVAARLGREAEVLERVQHPSLVRLLGTVEDDRGRTLLLHHAPGGSLAHRVHHHGPMSAAATADTGARVARALAALHRAGVVHRDVHPGNILVDAELQPVLADLDNALDHAGEHIPGDDEVVGEPTHIDHRLLAGEVPGPTSDLHALATTLWSVATGAHPPRRSPHDPVRFPTSDPRVPARLLKLLRACVAGECGDAATVAARLEGLAVELGDWSMPVPGAAPPPPQGPRVRGATEPAATGVDRVLAPGERRPAPKLEAGGRGGAADPVTRRWGPAPRPLPTVRADRHPRRRLPAAAALVALITLVLVWRWAATGGGPPSGELAEVVPPAPCASGASVATTAPGDDGPAPATGTITLADLDGNGCSEALELVDGELRTSTERYHLGQEGDVLLAGDWDGDGRWTVGMYRPATGAVYLFDTGPGPDARSRPAEQHPANGIPRVVAAPDGSHRVQVTSRPPSTRG